MIELNMERFQGHLPALQAHLRS